MNDAHSHDYTIDGYTVFDMHRMGKVVGGVGMFISADMSFFLRDDLCCIDEICETIFIEIEKSAFGYDKKLIIGVLYCPLGSDLSLFNEKMKDIMDSIDDNDTYCFIMGD